MNEFLTSGQLFGLVQGAYIIAGLCFILPAFVIMLALAAVYLAYGTLPSLRSAFYGIGPVVLGLFAVAVYRLGRNAIKERTQIAIAVAAAAAMVLPPVGLATILLLAGCAGIAAFDSRRHGLVGLVVVSVGLAVARLIEWLYADPSAAAVAKSSSIAMPSVWELGPFFFKVGALTFGGGLSLLAFMQEQVVVQFAWLTPQEFVDGLALGQLTPGPILMLAAFIGFKLHGIVGATVSAGAIFLPSFLMMLTILPALRKMGDLAWLKAFMRGVGPAVIGALAVSLVQMAPHAAPDWVTWVLLLATIAVLFRRNVAPLPLMLGGGAIGLFVKSGIVGKIRDMVR